MQGNCPLFDNTAERHDDEVKKAEAAALEKVRAENPHLNEAELKVRVSDAVARDEEARKLGTKQRRDALYGARRPPAAAGPGVGAIPAPGYNPAHYGQRPPAGPIPAYQPAPHVHNQAYGGVQQAANPLQPQQVAGQAYLNAPLPHHAPANAGGAAILPNMLPHRPIPIQGGADPAAVKPPRPYNPQIPGQPNNLALAMAYEPGRGDPVQPHHPFLG